MQGPELLVVLLVLLVVFGGTLLPRTARHLGRAKREFQAGLGTTAAPREKA